MSISQLSHIVRQVLIRVYLFDEGIGGKVTETGKVKCQEILPNTETTIIEFCNFASLCKFWKEYDHIMPLSSLDVLHWVSLTVVLRWGLRKRWPAQRHKVAAAAAWQDS